MDKSKDPNSSAWVFVYGNVNPDEKIVNAFHLDCSREPIQELTENDLSLPGSDIESDKSTDTSDGISIISESEIPIEENCSAYRDCLKIEDIHGSQIVEDRIVCTNRLCIQPLEDGDPNWDWKKLINIHNLLSTGILVSAVLVALCSSSKIWRVPEETFSAGISNNFEDVVDNTIACACGEKPRNTLETEAIKQCVYNRLNTYDNSAKYNANGDTLTDNNKVTTDANDKIVQDDNFNIKDKTSDLNVKKLKKVDHGKNDKKKSHDKNEKRQKHLKAKQKKLTLSGDWYSNMHKYRAELRKRNEKKDRARWYFKKGNVHRRHYRD